jgi:KUP system potassium uptake protein
MATIIASQAALTGSFSVAKQAVQLGFMPRLRIVHTAEVEGQIYVPIINWLLCAGVVALVLVFRNSNKLSDIYGVAVTGTFILDTTLFVAVARSLWQTPKWRLFPMVVLFYVVEVSFFSANVTKVAHGAWLPLLVGVVVANVMLTWRKGRDMLTRNRTEEEGSLQEFLEGLCSADPPIVRLPGTAIFLNPNKQTTPLAMRAQVEHLHAFQETVVMVSLDPIPIPHVDKADRFAAERLGKGMFKIIHVTIRTGYRDRTNLPVALALARKQGMLPRNFDLENASYFVSRMSIAQTDGPGMPRWRKRLFIAMARNSSSPIEHFGLPWDRTVTSGSQVGL